MTTILMGVVAVVLAVLVVSALGFLVTGIGWRE